MDIKTFSAHALIHASYYMRLAANSAYNRLRGWEYVEPDFAWGRIAATRTLNCTTGELICNEGDRITCKMVDEIKSGRAWSVLVRRK